jgi:glycosyltransferase 2 family protein
MRRALHVLGALLAVGFCGLAFWKGSRELPAIAWGDPALWGWLGLTLVLYVLSQLIAARAWAGILWMFSVRLPRHRAETQLLVSQIGKYIPGNVAHLLGRFALARDDGVPAASIAMALLVEVGLVLVVAAILLVGILLAAPELVASLVPASARMTGQTLTRLILAGLATAIAVCVWIVGRRLRRGKADLTLAPSRAGLPAALHAGNFGVLGLSLACVVAALVPGGQGGVLLPVAVFILAWTVGFLTPGAPGGLGVREGLIVLGLGLAIGSGPALAAALLHRAVAMTGDLVSFALGLALRPSRPD